MTVKDIAQVLQSFGSELSETELPDEANAIEFLLHSHTHRYRQMKVRTFTLLLLSSAGPPRAVSRCSLHLTLSGRHPKRVEGGTSAAVQPGDGQGLKERHGGGGRHQGRHGHSAEVEPLQSLGSKQKKCLDSAGARQKNPAGPGPPSLWERRDGGGRLTCRLLCRLLAQLRDMEEAFDGFFEKHHLKLQQYLQLLQYEISFQQVGLISSPAPASPAHCSAAQSP